VKVQHIVTRAQPFEAMLTARQVADFLQVHISTLRRWSDQGILKSYRVGPRRDRRYKQEDVLGFVSEDHIAGGQGGDS
jgi:excisionase family DNA binding protein